MPSQFVAASILQKDLSFRPQISVFEQASRRRDSGLSTPFDATTISFLYSGTHDREFRIDTSFGKHHTNSRFEEALIGGVMLHHLVRDEGSKEWVMRSDILKHRVRTAKLSDVRYSAAVKVNCSKAPLIDVGDLHDEECIVSLSAFGLDENAYNQPPISITTVMDTTLILPLQPGLVRSFLFEDEFLWKSGSTAFHDRICLIDIEEKVVRVINHDGCPLPFDLDAAACLTAFLRDIEGSAVSLKEFRALHSEEAEKIGDLERFPISLHRSQRL